jgi:hypothetical protein
MPPLQEVIPFEKSIPEVVQEKSSTNDLERIVQWDGHGTLINLDGVRCFELGTEGNIGNSTIHY